MTAAKLVVLFFLVFSSSLACIATSTPDGRPAYEEETETTTSIMLTTVMSSTEATTSAAPMCPDPSYELNPANNFCYFIVPGSATEPEAECLSHGGAHAASIADMAENDWISTYLTTVSPNTEVYTGGIATGPAYMLASWSWSDMSLYSWTNWEPYMMQWPTDSLMADCMRISSYSGTLGLWYNFVCNDPMFPKLCKIAAV